MRAQGVAPAVWPGLSVALWMLGLLSCVAPLAAHAQAANVAFPPGESLAGSSVQVSRWVSDVGTCAAPPCITTVAPGDTAIDFQATPPASIAQVDAAEGVLNPNSNTPLYWDLSAYTGITLYFEDLNAANSQKTTAYSHYFLIYDNNHCYRQWVINLVQASGLPLAGSPTIAPGQWYQVSGSFATAQSLYVTQGGTPVNGIACNSKPLNFKDIGYFEAGLWGGPMRASDKINYQWRVSGVTPFKAP
jgi:hypothetical protein